MSGRSARNRAVNQPTWRTRASGPNWPLSCREAMTRSPAASMRSRKAGVRIRVTTLTT